MSLTTLAQNPPLSLYVHLPWCVRKCPYCDFNSHTLKNTLPESDYINKCIQDLTIACQSINERPLHSIFIGGGTPSLMSAGFYKELLAFVAEHIDITASTEITLEANPGTTESSKFFGYREAGINRLSVGVQSFQTHQLENLGSINNRRGASVCFKPDPEIFGSEFNFKRAWLCEMVG